MSKPNSKPGEYAYDIVTNISPDRVGKYWICDECANAKKWIGPTWPVTCTSGLCGWCDRKDETFLTPCCDFSGPNGKKAIWD